MKRALAAAAGVFVALSVFAAVAVATHRYTGTAETVMVISDGGPGGNYACPANTIPGPKIDPGANYADADLVVSGFDGTTFDWAFTDAGKYRWDMALVIVKGGPASAVYTYDYEKYPAYDDADENLSAPTNPRNGKDYGISHIQFCFDPKNGGDD